MHIEKFLKQLYPISRIPYGLVHNHTVISNFPSMDITALFAAKFGNSKKNFSLSYEMSEIYSEIYIVKLFLNSGECIVLGPVTSFPINYQLCYKLLKSLDIPTFYTNECVLYFRTFSSISFSYLAETAIFIYNTFMETEITCNQLLEMINKKYTDQLPQSSEESIYHGNQEFSEELYSLIQYGKTSALSEFLTTTHNYGNIAILSKHPLQHLKYLMTASCSTAQQYAIRGGLPYEQALSVFEKYIHKFENAQSTASFAQIHSSMLLEYSRLVDETNNGLTQTALTRKIISFINQHLEEKITVNNIAKKLHMSPSYISSAYKKEIGISLSEYINHRKIIEATYFLKTTNMTITEIADRLAYPSSAYFSSVFKKITLKTPTEFRNENK